MEFTVVICDLDKPSINGRTYSRECIAELCEKFKGVQIPLKVCTEDTYPPSLPVGIAILEETNYPNISFKCECSDILMDMVKIDNTRCGFALNGVADVDSEGVINKFIIRGLNCCSYPARKSIINKMKNNKSC